MKLVELLYQNRDKFAMHPYCKWIAQDEGYQIYQFSYKPVINHGDSDHLSNGGLCVLSLSETNGITLSSDWRSPLSREEYDQYCKERDSECAKSIDSNDAATAVLPKPSGKGNPVLGMVLADLTNRAFEGVKKYGEPLKADNGRDALVDAYQEALDLCMYLRQAIEERSNG